MIPYEIMDDLVRHFYSLVEVMKEMAVMVMAIFS